MTAVLTLAAATVVMLMTASPSSAEKASASIQAYKFMPGDLTVKVGDTITWTNNDTAPHTVTTLAGPVPIGSPTLKKGDTFSFTFTKPGVYQYGCSIHPDMKAKVTVLAGPAATSPMPESANSAHGPNVPVPAAVVPVPPAPGDPAAPEPMPVAPPVPCVGPGGSDPIYPLLVHLRKAHLEESPGQQAGDLLNVEQYVKTHTVLAEDMLNPVVGPQGGAVSPLWAHLKKAHLEEAPGEQAADLLNLDQYVKTHTVLVEDMVSGVGQPGTGIAC